MSVITISREFGSVGDDFGERVAQALGYHCLCKEEIAALLSEYGMVEFDREYDSRLSFWEGFTALRDRRRGEMVTMLNQVVQAVAQHGDVVIQGRSGFAVLKDFADVLKVINTDKISADRAVTWVADAAKALALSPATGKPTTRSIAVDSVLARAVADVLHDVAAHC